MNRLRVAFAPYWQSIQHALFPQLERVLGPLTEKQQQLVQTLEVIRIEQMIPRRLPVPGRPPKDRAAMARALVAKAIYDMPTTRVLLDRLDTDVALRRMCGWERRSTRRASGRQPSRRWSTQGPWRSCCPRRSSTNWPSETRGSRSSGNADEGEEARRLAGPVPVRIGSRSMSTECIVGPAGSEPLVGHLVLERLDLIADRTNRTLTPRRPNYPLLKLK